MLSVPSHQGPSAFHFPILGAQPSSLYSRQQSVPGEGCALLVKEGFPEVPQSTSTHSSLARSSSHDHA